jgi:hypothetical protein
MAPPAKSAPSSGVATSLAAEEEARAEPTYTPRASDVTELRAARGLQDAGDHDDDESGEFAVDDDELIDDQPPS